MKSTLPLLRYAGIIGLLKGDIRGYSLKSAKEEGFHCGNAGKLKFMLTRRHKTAHFLYELYWVLGLGFIIQSGNQSALWR